MSMNLDMFFVVQRDKAADGLLHWDCRISGNLLTSAFFPNPRSEHQHNVEGMPTCPGKHISKNENIGETTDKR
jgi:hypothetical protein